MTNKRDFDTFYRLGKDILTHEMFEKQKLYYQHGHTTLYDHVVLVAYISFVIGKAFSLNTKPIIRGALLHDFFLYDWHKEGERIKKRGFNKHGFTHAKTALRNARQYFDINKIEKDIIVKHMFPLNIAPPIYVESWLVNMVDNLVTFSDYFNHFATLKTELLSWIEVANQKSKLKK